MIFRSQLPGLANVAAAVLQTTSSAKGGTMNAPKIK
jgi:hypothetical protein